VDARADLYTAGLILYILLAGRGPFDHHEGQLVLAAHAVEEPKPPSHHAPQSIPEALDRVVLRALRKDPDERFQTAEAFQRALLDAGASASARRDTPAARRAAKQAGEALRGTASALAVGAIFLLTGAASAAAVAALYGAP
jgi:serine/threonine-protein kinase